MTVEELINSFAVKVDSQISERKQWVTKSRGDYVTLEGMEYRLNFLIDRGITENIQSSWNAGMPINIGFNPIEKKWYGWSHRAVYGFGVGSTCKKGEIHYRPVDKNDFMDDMIRFWTEPGKYNVTAEHRKDGVYVEWEYDHSIKNEKLRGQITGCLNQYPEKYGKGEWKAETLSDALQMAIDFANNIA